MQMLITARRDRAHANAHHGANGRAHANAHHDALSSTQVLLIDECYGLNPKRSSNSFCANVVDTIVQKVP
jgi:hypothetical protein